MIIKYSLISILSLLVMIMSVSGCADKSHTNGNDGIIFNKVAEFTDRRGQAKIRLFVYSGEAEKKNIKVYTESLGCGMLFAYFYPDSIPRSEIPIEELETAKSFVHANDILFKGEGYARWHYASQCISIIPTVTDCYESPISTNCR